MKFEDYLKNTTRDFKLKNAMMRTIWVMQIKKQNELRGYVATLTLMREF